jgi:hypothetical protein
MTPERKAQIRALLNPTPKPPPSKPKVVTSNGATIRNAVVRVAPEDPNAKARNDRIVLVTINQLEAERQRAEEEWEAERDKRLYEASCRQCIWTNPNDY